MHVWNTENCETVCSFRQFLLLPNYSNYLEIFSTSFRTIAHSSQLHLHLIHSMVLFFIQFIFISKTTSIILQCSNLIENFVFFYISKKLLDPLQCNEKSNNVELFVLDEVNKPVIGYWHFLEESRLLQRPLISCNI
jgi:hypothetical protein